jgi:nicotinate phosphoribosyltransferase
VNDRPVAKLSDSPGKEMCLDRDYLVYLRRSVDFRLHRADAETKK